MRRKRAPPPNDTGSSAASRLCASGRGTPKSSIWTGQRLSQRISNNSDLFGYSPLFVCLLVCLLICLFSGDYSNMNSNEGSETKIKGKSNWDDVSEVWVSMMQWSNHSSANIRAGRSILARVH